MRRRLNYPALAASGLIIAIGLVLAARQFPIPLARALFGYGAAPGPVRSAPPPPVCPGPQEPGGAYLFTGGCKGQVLSPDGRVLIVKNGAPGEGVGLVRAADGRSLDDLGLFDDGKGFSVGWSPTGDWIYVDHPGPSGAAQLHVYRVESDHLVSEDALPAAVQSGAGCASRAVEGKRWLADGKRIVLRVTATAACGGAGWMIGDVRTGKVDPRSIRQMASGPVPTDGPYAVP